MKQIFILFLFSVAPFAHAIDVGDGSDGACTDAIFTATPAKRIFQCTTLTLTGAHNYKGLGGNLILIKVQNDVSISATASFDLRGNAGVNGGSAIANGGAAGPGGGAGGTSVIAGDGNNGAGTGAGTRGKFVAEDPATSGSYGGGGGGGSFLSKSGTEPANGDTPNSSPAPLTKGANGTNPLTSESQFDSTFNGGPGGASGGGGIEAGTGTLFSGSSGGGGGGAIRIVSGGNIVLDGSITADGGNGGGDGSVAAAGGGGGSGGAIWMQATGTLTVNASAVLSAQPGVQGTSDIGAGDGGIGGNGGIRLDSGGAISVAVATTPNYYHTTFAPTSIVSPITTRQYTSSISCAKVSENFNHNFLINSLFGFAIAALAHLAASSKKRKV
jgi:hypothetical protein